MVYKVMGVIIFLSGSSEEVPSQAWACLVPEQRWGGSELELSMNPVGREG